MTRVVSAIRKLQILFILTLILGGMRVARGQEALEKYTDKDAYDVFSVLLAPASSSDSARSKIVIEIETSDYPRFGGDKTDCLAPADSEKAVYGQVVAAYRDANKKQWLLQPQFAASFPYRLVSSASVKEIFAKEGFEGWNDFYKKYPTSGGLTSLSAVGFNSDKTLAIVYMGNSCGYLCGSGRYHFVKKINGAWAEFEWHGIICTWAS